MAVSMMSRLALVCLIAAALPLSRAGCDKEDACPAGQCCGGVVIFGKCRGIGCTCFCPATSGDVGCMITASKHLLSNPGDMAKCGSAISKTGSLAAQCAGGNTGSCLSLGKQMIGLRKM